MKSLAFLSMDDLDDFVVYDQLTYAPFAARGVAVEAIPWRSAERWSRFDAVVIRSPWDYQDDWRRFLEVLTEIDRATRLENPLTVVRWNVDKGYLRDLERRGVPVVPTLWADRWPGADVARAWHDRLGVDELVVKPRVSANADDTHRLDRVALAESSPRLATVFAARALMVQPFVPAVVEEGELSLFSFDGRFSHAVLKTPAVGDFRVQEEHGGVIRAIEPEPAALEIGRRALDAVEAATGASSLYARVDLVRTAADDSAGWRLMEVELIEPSLYFSYDEASPARFVDAAIRRWGW